MAIKTSLGLSILAISLPEAEDLERDARKFGLDASSPTRSPPPANLALDLGQVLEIGSYVYQTLLFINALSKTVEFFSSIRDKLAKRAASSDKNNGPALLVTFEGKAYPLATPNDVTALQDAIEKAATR